MNWLFVNLAWAALTCAKCYEYNTAFPPPDYDPSDPFLRNAFQHLESALTAAAAPPEFDATSFSIEVTSSKETLWSQHHTARLRNVSRPDTPVVNGDALYRIASITKSFTVLGLLYQHAAGNLSLDDSIDTYIEELKGEQEGTIPWKDITLRALASQLSGIPREFAQGDLLNVPSYAPFPPERMGFPPVSRKNLPDCDEYAENYDPACGRDDLLDTVKAQAPVFAPKQKSTYSNVAFELLGLAIANVTNQTYESYIDSAIFKPLEMTKSTMSLPSDSAGVIPLQPHYWDVDAGIQNPTGGIYSSSTDLSKYLRHILKHYNGITTALNWAHLTSPAEGLHSFYGTPWEIFRTDKILKKSRRTVSFITKGGGLPGYTSIIITVPDYELGITILVAGKGEYLAKALELVTGETVRAAEELAIRQLSERYVGTYVSTQSGADSSLTLIADHRGLVIDKFTSNATDVLASPLPRRLGAPKEGRWYAQVVPTLLNVDEKNQKGERWRFLIADERTEDEGDIWDDFCMTNTDTAVYAGLPANEIVFWKGHGRVVDTIDLPGFRSNLSRKHMEYEGYPKEEQEIFEL